MEIPGIERFCRQARQVGVLCFTVAASAALALAQAKPAQPPTPADRLPDSYQIYSLLMPGQVFTDMDPKPTVGHQRHHRQ